MPLSCFGGGSGGGGGSIAGLTADAAVALRDVVYMAAASVVTRANASAIGTSHVMGVVSALAAGIATVTFSGRVTGFAGLTSGRWYIASKTAGGYVWEGTIGAGGASPTVAGDVICIVGVALSATEILVMPQLVEVI